MKLSGRRPLCVVALCLAMSFASGCSHVADSVGLGQTQAEKDAALSGAALFCDVYNPVGDRVLDTGDPAVIANEAFYLEVCLGLIPPGGPS